MKKVILSILILATIILAFCNNTDDATTTKNLTLSINGLEDLGSNYVYEGWLMVNGSPISSGRFTVNASGQMSQSSFAINETSLNSATAFILTIEPATNDNPAPSDVHLLAGDFNGSTGTVTVGHAAALNNTFASAAGKYILATPTDGGSMNNEESGIWFLDNSSGAPTTGLSLPTLPAGWKYEGWVVFNGTPVSTGTFTSNAGSDSNATTSSYKGSANAGPAFPGEDFLQNAPSGINFPTDLRGKTIAISIEPYPDNSAKPFLLKPLLNTIPTSATVHTALNMTKDLTSFPTGSFNR